MTTAGAPSAAHHSAPISLMSCVRESSPQDAPLPVDAEPDRNEPSKKRRFHPFRGLKKMFRRKVRHSGSEEAVLDVGSTSQDDSVKDPHRSRSTSELLAGDDSARRKSGTVIFPGLSVSHDSVFTADQHSTHSNSDMDLDTAQSSSSLSIQQLIPDVRAELLDAVRRRRGRGETSDDDEDLGLPRSPCNSPTTTDLEKSGKEHVTKSHSTCSDGSLLSMESSEMDEESFGQTSKNSSKLSLHDRRPSQTDGGLELGLTTGSEPLSHKAARHKIAVKPKRTHGAPRRRRVQQLTSGAALPTTPEVNEETSTRSLTPESVVTRETVCELYKEGAGAGARAAWAACAASGPPAAAPGAACVQLKSASLPPGVALPPAAGRLSRSRSNAGSGRDALAEEDEPHAPKDERRKEDSFFGRFLARRSAKKKKAAAAAAVAAVAAVAKPEEAECASPVTAAAPVTPASPTKSVHGEPDGKPSAGVGGSALRTGPAARQRVLPIDIPASPDGLRIKRQQHVDLDVPMPPPAGDSPENATFLELSPPRKKPALPPQPAADPPPVVAAVAPVAPVAPVTPVTPVKPQWPDKRITTFSEIKDDAKTKVKISGLSSYQQRVLSYNDEFDSFQSLNESDDSMATKQVTKSQSFRTAPLITGSQDSPSLPFVINSFGGVESESTDSLEPIDPADIAQSEEDVQEIKIVNNNNEVVNLEEEKSPRAKSNSTENVSSVMITSDETFTSSTEAITISCVNSQVQASVNTQSTNQVIVSISSPAEPGPVLVETDKALKTTEPQVSVTKVQFKRDSRAVENTSYVPEFLKIQLNKVDAKPVTNIVLSTSPENSGDEKKTIVIPEVVESKNELEVAVEHKRKFSKDDVEIIDKDSSEEVVEVPVKNVSMTSVLAVKPCTPASSPEMKHNSVNSVSLRKSSLVTPSSQTKPFLKKKSNSVDLPDINRKSLEESVTDKNMTVSADKLVQKAEVVKEKAAVSDACESQPPDVILRKKSLASQKRDKDSEEPELMKVFARRSLKLKDSEAESLSQQVLVLVENSDGQTSDCSSNRSRDSDKENENESPHEERKKNSFSSKEAPKIKEPLTESKFVETSEVILRKPTPAVNNKLSAFNSSKFSRIQSLGTAATNEANTNDSDKRKHKTLIEPKPDTKPTILEKSFNRVRVTNFKEKEVDTKKSTDINKCNKNSDEMITHVSLKNDFENEEYVTMFKRIQQRKEEWEQRAQQAMKKTAP